MREQTSALSLADECATLARYLMGRDAPELVVRAYQRAHGVCEIDRPAGPLDRALMTFARGGPGFARAADALAAFCCRAGVLRRKVVLLVAILESFGATSDAIDTADGRSFAWFVCRTACAVCASVLAALFAALAIVPLAAWLALRGAADPGRPLDETR